MDTGLTTHQADSVQTYFFYLHVSPSRWLCCLCFKLISASDLHMLGCISGGNEVHRRSCGELYEAHRHAAFLCIHMTPCAAFGFIWTVIDTTFCSLQLQSLI